jgi:hypothetical protein
MSRKEGWGNWLELKVIFCHVDGPGKLLSLGFVVDLLDGNFPLLAPAQKKTKGAKEGSEMRENQIGLGEG